MKCQIGGLLNCKSGPGARAGDELLTDPTQYLEDKPLSSAGEKTLNKHSMILYRDNYILRWEQYLLKYPNSMIRPVFIFPN